MTSDDPTILPIAAARDAAIPFESAEQAWFWFIRAQQARADGARVSRGLGLTPRPCEPVDILQSLDRLYRAKRLSMDHLLVLRHYGRRGMPPDPHRPRESRAWRLWTDSMARLSPVLERKKIIRAQGMLAPWQIGQAKVISINAYRGTGE